MSKKNQFEEIEKIFNDAIKLKPINEVTNFKDESDWSDYDDEKDERVLDFDPNELEKLNPSFIMTPDKPKLQKISEEDIQDIKNAANTALIALGDIEAICKKYPAALNTDYLTDIMYEIRDLIEDL